MAKAAYIITDMQNAVHTVDCIEQEYATEAKALKAAKAKLNSGNDDMILAFAEAWFSSATPRLMGEGNQT